MRIDSPQMTNAVITGSFSGSFTGVGNFTGLEADSVEYANVLNKPSLISGSEQVVISDTDGFTAFSQSIAQDISGLDGEYATDAELNAVSASVKSFATNADTSLSSSLAIDISSNASAIGTLQTNSATKVELNASSSALISGYETADTDLSASLAIDIAANTGKVGYSDALVKAKMNNDLVVSGSASAVRTFLNVEDGADVTDTANVTAAGALMDSELTSLSGVKSLTVPDSTTISSFGASLVDDADAAAARTTLGAAASADNSEDVTLVTGSHDYLSISGQAITLGTIDISADTNLGVSDTTGQTGIDLSLTGDTLSGTVSGLTTTSNVTFAGITATGNVTVEGNLTVEGTTTTVNTETLAVEDNMIYLNSGSAVTNPDLGFAGNYNDGTYAHAGFFSDASDAHTFKVYKGYTPEPDAASHIDTTHASFTLADFTAANITASGSIAVTGTVDGRNIASDGDKLDNIEANADVTDTDNVRSAGALMDDEVDADLKTFSLPANTTISAFGKTLVDDADAATARTTLGVDAAGTVNYTHPSHPGDDIDIDTTALTGATVISDLDINITTDTEGHVTDANATVATRDLTLADLGYTGDSDANNYSLPLGSSTVRGGFKIGYTENGQNYPVEISSEKMYVNVPWTDTTYTLPEATATTRGGIELFSNTDQAVAANAVTATAGRTYGIQLNSAGQAVVNVPWVDTNTTYTRASFIDQDVNTNSNVTFNRVTVDTYVQAAAGSGGGFRFPADPGGGSGDIAYMRYIVKSGEAMKLHLDVNNDADDTIHLDAVGGTDVENDLRATGDVIAYYSSDKRLKDNIKPIEGALEKVEALGGYEFDWNDQQKSYEGHDVGVIAQEVEAIFPELVTTRDTGFKAVKYEKLTAVLIQAVKELSARVKELENK